jgi:hypothetical protein
MNTSETIYRGFKTKKTTFFHCTRRFKTLTVLLFVLPLASLTAQIELPYKNNQTLPYDQVIDLYHQLDQEFKTAKLIETGTTDVGKPLHLFIISKDQVFEPERVRKAGKRVVFILNGIHPGESCGVDASLLFADDLLRNKNNMGSWIDNTVVCIVPVYNIGGYLNRSAWNRANQVGPEETGFRGNARNLDLNRDFIKTDTKNARSFTTTFRAWDPDVFLDTHTTDGSDHQYTITLIATNSQKIHPLVGQFMDNKFVPGLYRLMKETPYEMTPYVNYIISSPENGITGYDDLPRLSTGYTSLFNTISFMTENHAYKPFADRVESVKHFMISLLRLTHEHADEIGQIREQARQETSVQKEYYIAWELDTSRFETITFKGYRRKQRTSPLTGREMWYYDHSEPYTKEIPYYRYFKPVKQVTKPDFYIIPQAWEHVIYRLELNIIKFRKLQEDTVIRVEAYYIDDVQTSRRLNNGHFSHNAVTTRTDIQEIQFYKGDYVIPTDQPGNRFLIETLEPEARDSYFSWNFFDPVLERREYFSPSTFDTMAVGILDSDPLLTKEYESRMETDADFAGNFYAQMSFIYSRSKWAEKSYRRYPVYRWIRSNFK